LNLIVKIENFVEGNFMNHQEVIEGMRILSKAISDVYHMLLEEEAPTRMDITAREIVNMFPRALGISQFLKQVDFNEQQPSPEAFNAQIKIIHNIMGAPGDWGYGTPIGSALRKILNFW